MAYGFNSHGVTLSVNALYPKTVLTARTGQGCHGNFTVQNEQMLIRFFAKVLSKTSDMISESWCQISGLWLAQPTLQAHQKRVMYAYLM